MAIEFGSCRFECMVCLRRLKKVRIRYGLDVVCEKCWSTAPYSLTYYYRYVRRRFKILDIADVDGHNPDWPHVAKSFAKNWSEIRGYFKITPELPAGLEGFMVDMGWWN